MTKKKTALSLVLLAMALTAAFFVTSPTIFAQSADNPPVQQAPMPNDQDSSAKMYSGKITKSGTKFVLTDAANKTTFQLDDQQKAQNFLNKNVKVTGVLDASTGTIRVTAIQPL